MGRKPSSLADWRWTDGRRGQCDNVRVRVSEQSSWSSRRHRCRRRHPARRVRALFGEGGSTADRRKALGRRASLLDWVHEDIARLQRQLGPNDRTKVDEYLSTVREVERRIEKAEAQTHENLLPDLDRPVGVPASYGEHVKLMFDLQVLALQGDMTRVIRSSLRARQATAAIRKSASPIRTSPTSHHGGDPEKIAKIAKINQFHVSLFAYFLDKLNAIKEGDATLLENSLYLYGRRHGQSETFTTMWISDCGGRGAAGKVKAEHIKYAEPAPLANLHITMLDAVGVRLDSFQDSTGKIDTLYKSVELSDKWVR